jgi:bis(5'-nucleosidyl)-tetraphosphatase
MVIEKSAGAVVFYRGDQIEYLLLLSSFWGFPKGHIESGESEPDAALREIHEETGLDVNLIEGFRVVDEYWYQHKGQRIKKQAIFFLGQAKSRESRISWEHEEMAWLVYDEAIKRLKFKSQIAVLERANEFLTKAEGVGSKT